MPPVFPERLTRRTFMSRSAAAAAGVFLTSCFGQKLSTSPTPRPTYGSSPSSVETRWPIDHVVYLMMENRSFDNLFGRFPGANGARTGNRWGQEVFETHEENNGWDGTYNGEPQDVDTYYYILQYTCADGSTHEKSGDVTLVR